jgi:hypothetical protein
MEALMTPMRRLACLGVVLGLAAFLSEARAQKVEAPEASVKAAFLFKFASFVEWPPAAFAIPDAPLVFGVVVGADEVAAELARIAAGRSIGGHPVVVRRVREGEATRGVHVLFVGHGVPERQAIIARAAAQPGLLVVTETQRGLEAGSAINFVISEDRVGFEVSLDAADKSGLRISSRMLGVARRVLPRAQ